MAALVSDRTSSGLQSSILWPEKHFESFATVGTINRYSLILKLLLLDSCKNEIFFLPGYYSVKKSYGQVSSGDLMFTWSQRLKIVLTPCYFLVSGEMNLMELDLVNFDTLKLRYYQNTHLISNSVQDLFNTGISYICEIIVQE